MSKAKDKYTKKQLRKKRRRINKGKNHKYGKG